MIKALIISLTITLVFELAAAAAAGVRSPADLAVVTLANTATNPAVVLIHILTMLYAPHLLLISTAVTECAAVITEWLIYRKALRFNKLPPFALSLILNLISFSAGELFNVIF